MKKQILVQVKSLSLLHHLQQQNFQIIYKSNWNELTMSILKIQQQLSLMIQLPNAHVLIARLIELNEEDWNNICIEEGQKQDVRIHIKNLIGSYEITVGSALSDLPSLHYHIAFIAAQSVCFSEQPYDLLILEQDFSPAKKGNICTEQTQVRSGICFFDFNPSEAGSLFYFQNLSSLCQYAEDSRLSMADTVKVSWPEVGFKLPVSASEPLRAGTTYTLKDSYIIFHPEKPVTPHQTALLFLGMQYRIYQSIEKPTVNILDFKELLDKSWVDLSRHKGCWQQVASDAFLNAYINDYPTPPESMVQLSVLWPALSYYLKYPSTEIGEIVETLMNGIPRFFDDKLGCLVRWIPQKAHHLDHAEEHKEPRVMDSWYLHHPLLHLAFILRAGHGDNELKKMFLASANFCIKVAKHFSYNWPIFYDMDTLEILKAEAAPDEGGEKDVAGLYAFLMLRAYELSGIKKYFEEAKRAARTLSQKDHDILYQANNTAHAAEALLELWAMTKNARFLQLSEICIANLLRNTALWDMNYGNAKAYPSFFMMFPLKDAPYAALFEEYECMASFTRYLALAHKEKAPLSREIHALLPEFTKYALMRLPYYYPPMLPEDSLASEVKTGYLNKKLWIPVEDLGDGWEPIGSVGQEVYGAGAIFYVGSQHIVYLDNMDSRCFIGYPILSVKRTGKAVSVQIAGSSEYMVPIRVSGDLKSSYTVRIEGRKYGNLSKKTPAMEVKGGQKLTISWK